MRRRKIISIRNDGKWSLSQWTAIDSRHLILRFNCWRGRINVFTCRGEDDKWIFDKVISPNPKIHHISYSELREELDEFFSFPLRELNEHGSLLGTTDLTATEAIVSNPQPGSWVSTSYRPVTWSNGFTITVNNTGGTDEGTTPNVWDRHEGNWFRGPL